MRQGALDKRVGTREDRERERQRAKHGKSNPFKWFASVRYIVSPATKISILLEDIRWTCYIRYENAQYESGKNDRNITCHSQSYSLSIKWTAGKTRTFWVVQFVQVLLLVSYEFLWITHTHIRHKTIIIHSDPTWSFSFLLLLLFIFCSPRNVVSSVICGKVKHLNRCKCQCTNDDHIISETISKYMCEWEYATNTLHRQCDTHIRLAWIKCNNKQTEPNIIIVINKIEMFSGVFYSCCPSLSLSFFQSCSQYPLSLPSSLCPPTSRSSHYEYICMWKGKNF